MFALNCFLHFLFQIKFADLAAGNKTLGAGAFGKVKLVQWGAAGVSMPPGAGGPPSGQTKKKGEASHRHTFALKSMSIQQIDETGHKVSVLNEKKCMQEMHHPFMPKLYATFKDEARLYMLIELMLGGELFTLIQNMSPLPETWVKFYAAQVRRRQSCLYNVRIVCLFLRFSSSLRLFLLLASAFLCCLQACT